MAFAVRILPITRAARVANSDRLSVFRILGYDAVSANNENGTMRFEEGERIVYVPEGSVIPEVMLREHGFWGLHPQHQVEMGLLSGPAGNVVKPLTLRGQLSTGLLWKLPAELGHLPDGADVTDHYGIKEWIPPVPKELLAVAMPLPSARLNYEIGRYKMYPDLLYNDEVVITEKLEGECLQITWIPEGADGIHGNGHVAVTTKGLARQGLVFKDVPEADKIPVIRGFKQADLLPLFQKMVKYLDGQDRKVRLLAEAIGAGVQKLHYGNRIPTARAFDIKIDERWLPEDEKSAAMIANQIERVPVLWRGKFDPDQFEALRQGQTTLDDTHIREGIVINAVGEQAVRMTALGDQIRPILKFHSDAFLKKFGIND